MPTCYKPCSGGTKIVRNARQWRIHSISLRLNLSRGQEKPPTSSTCCLDSELIQGGAVASTGCLQSSGIASSMLLIICWVSLNYTSLYLNLLRRLQNSSWLRPTASSPQEAWGRADHVTPQSLNQWVHDQGLTKALLYTWWRSLDQGRP